MDLAHPLSVQFTRDQLAWLDSLRSAGISRSAVLRLVVDDAMRRGAPVQASRREAA